jgi:hypothetical protein
MQLAELIFVTNMREEGMQLTLMLVGILFKPWPHTWLFYFRRFITTLDI